MAALVVFLLAIVSTQAAEDPGITRMALCRDSWFDWQKSDPAKLKSFGEKFRGEFRPRQNEPYVVPVTNVTVAGLHVEQAFPDSVGMGVGFSLTVDAPFDAARKAVEKALGRRLAKCDAGDGMHMCGLEIADKRTFTLMAEDDEPSKTLVGCYYFYEK